MKWYVVQTKPRQEFRAKENLENQGYLVYVPTCIVQKIRNSQIIEQIQALFSRYLFIKLDDVNTNWAPIRSTRGVHQMLRFGQTSMPLSVPDSLVEDLQNNQIILKKPPIQANAVVSIDEGPFRGFEGVFQKLIETDSGEVRALILLEFLGKQQTMMFVPENIKPLTSY